MRKLLAILRKTRKTEKASEKSKYVHLTFFLSFSRLQLSSGSQEKITAKTSYVDLDGILSSCCSIHFNL